MPRQENSPAGCSKSLSSEAAGKSKPEAYPQGYVEDFDEPRTKLADFFSILSVRHLLVTQSNMVSEFMDHCVSNFVNHFSLRPAEAQDRTSIDGNTGGQLTSRLKKRRLIDRNALIQTQQIVF